VQSADEVREAVRKRYAAAALSVRDAQSGCCGPASSVESTPAQQQADPFGVARYDDTLGEDGVPEAAALASLGCGNPTAVAELLPGETVLDLGSGGGLDVILSARRVGPEGRAYGLDMTDEMLELARRNQAEAGVDNVEFLKGDIEDIPLPDSSVDVIISNCVINLSVDKPAVLREAHRVLRTGGRFAVSDVVTRRDFTDAEKADLASWSGCIAGALTEAEYRDGLAAAGFCDVEIVPTRDIGEDAFTAVVRAVKP